LAHFLSLQAELKPVWVRISKRTVHRHWFRTSWQ